VLDVRIALELLEEWEEAAVDDHGAVVRVAGDIREIGRVQPQVQGVQNEPAARDPEVGLEVLVVVPAQRRDAVSAVEAELLQGDGELPGSPRHVPVRVAVEALVGKPGDDLLVPEERLRSIQDRRERELVVHHQAVHCRTLLGRPTGNRSLFPAARKALTAREIPLDVDELPVAAHVPLFTTDDEHDEVLVGPVVDLPRGRGFDVDDAARPEVERVTVDFERCTPAVDEVELVLLVVIVEKALLAGRVYDRIDTERRHPERPPDAAEAGPLTQLVDRTLGVPHSAS
jgi:hypothetical protein